MLLAEDGTVGAQHLGAGVEETDVEHLAAGLRVSVVTVRSAGAGEAGVNNGPAVNWVVHAWLSWH